MHTYEINLSPKGGTKSSNITTEVCRARSDSEARRLAETPDAGYYITYIRQVN